MERRLAYHIKQLRRKNRRIMTGICGLIGREVDDLESKAENILSLMHNRGTRSRTFSRSLLSGEKIVLGVCNFAGAQSLADQTVPLALDGVFFGGLDSALVAYVAKRSGLEPELISVGLKGHQELGHAEKTAKSFGLHVEISELSSSDILDSLPDVVQIIETIDPVIVGISIPIYFACQRAREMGLSYIAAGQLSDELFGGYGKFEEIALR